MAVDDGNVNFRRDILPGSLLHVISIGNLHPVPHIVVGHRYWPSHSGTYAKCDRHVAMAEYLVMEASPVTSLEEKGFGCDDEEESDLVK